MSIGKPSKRSKLSRFAQAALDFGLRRNGIYRLMFASRTMACAAKGSELHAAAMETFGLLLEAFEAPAIGFLRERQALKIWAALHGVIMLAEQGLLTGQLAHISREELVEDIVEQTKLALSVAIEAAEAAHLDDASSRSRQDSTSSCPGASRSDASRRMATSRATFEMTQERAPHHEESLLRRPRIDRRGAADAQNILQHPGAGEQLRLAARRRHHLQSDRQA